MVVAGGKYWLPTKRRTCSSLGRLFVAASVTRAYQARAVEARVAPDAAVTARDTDATSSVQPVAGVDKASVRIVYKNAVARHVRALVSVVPRSEPTCQRFRGHQVTAEG